LASQHLKPGGSSILLVGAAMAHTTGVIGMDLNKMTRPESIMLPFMP